MRNILRKIVTLVISVSLSFGTLGNITICDTVYAAETTANFEIDSELWRCMMETNQFNYDNNKDGIVTKDEFGSAYGMIIDCKGYEIKDWSALKNATEWQMIAIKNCPEGDFSVLAEINKLTKLALYGISDIKEIKGLDKLTKPTHLDISTDNSIALGDFSNFSELISLSLTASQYTGYDSLSQYSNLRSLNLAGDSIEGIESIPELSKLSSLSLEFLDLDDELLSEIIVKTPELTDISINKSEITNMDWLRKLNITEYGSYHIDVSDNQISDISALLEVIDIIDEHSELSLAGNLLDETARIQLLDRIIAIEDKDILYVGNQKDVLESSCPNIDIAFHQFLKVESSDNEIVEVVDNQVIAKKSGTSTLEFSYSEDIEFAYEITVKDEETDIPNPTETPDVTATPEPVTYPTESPTPEPSVTPEPVYGDVDYDGVICAEDALLVLKHAARLEVIPEESIAIADVVKDNVVDAKDALEILKHAAILIEDFN